VKIQPQWVVTTGKQTTEKNGKILYSEESEGTGDATDAYLRHAMS
jgi:hypothetical protein